ncbi:hypothetical protein CEXT_232141 [Caerostris extrusa]|uniref:Uncharacterized protein n=1 Tax=Caerostris extrusa TaxID=172846 RepID=A0AAV4T2B6_CAEEX|nr:hypothetical protein CEXT_232141 [Caerostris extrusa]
MLTQLFLTSFGKRSGGSGRRVNECLILEPSEMIVLGARNAQGSNNSKQIAWRNAPSPAGGFAVYASAIRAAAFGRKN